MIIDSVKMYQKNSSVIFFFLFVATALRIRLDRLYMLSRLYRLQKPTIATIATDKPREWLDVPYLRTEGGRKMMQRERRRIEPCRRMPSETENF